RRDTTQRLISLALLLAAAFGLALAVHSKPTTSADSSQTIIQFSDRIEKDNTPSGSNETTVRFDPELQKELLAYLRKQPTSESAVVVIFLVLAAGAFLWWAIKYRPSAVPVIGAGELANAMILGADHLSQPGGGYFWGVVYALLLIGFLL